jgi:hypothetical protein
MKRQNENEHLGVSNHRLPWRDQKAAQQEDVGAEEVDRLMTKS